MKAARLLNLTPGSIVAMDRANNDYRLFARWTEDGVFFVTRMKENAVYDVIEERDFPRRRNSFSDQIIRLSGAESAKKCPHHLAQKGCHEATRLSRRRCVS